VGRVWPLLLFVHVAFCGEGLEVLAMQTLDVFHKI
jgi:hypothetical protein